MNYTEEHKRLAGVLDNKLSWKPNTEAMTKKLDIRLYMLRKHAQKCCKCFTFQLRKCALLGAMCWSGNIISVQCAGVAISSVCNVLEWQYQQYAMCWSGNIISVQCAGVVISSVCNVLEWQYHQCAMCWSGNIISVQCVGVAISSVCNVLEWQYISSVQCAGVAISAVYNVLEWQYRLWNRLETFTWNGDVGREQITLYPHRNDVYRACKWVTIHGVTPRDWSLLGTKRD